MTIINYLLEREIWVLNCEMDDEDFTTAVFDVTHLLQTIATDNSSSQQLFARSHMHNNQNPST